MKTIDIQTILCGVQTGTNKVQTIGMGFNSKFEGGGVTVSLVPQNRSRDSFKTVEVQFYLRYEQA